MSDICDVGKRYFAGASLKEFEFPNIVKNLSESELIAVVIDSPLAQKYPLAISYRLKFIRKLLDSAEENGIELDDLYTVYCQLLTNQHQDDVNSYKIFVKSFDDHQQPQDYVVIRQSNSLISGGTTGLSVWQGGQDLFRFIHANQSVFRGKNLLELGSGLGLTGLLTVKSGLQCGFLFSDCHGQVLDFLQWNFEENMGKPNFNQDCADMDLSAGVKLLRLANFPQPCGVLELDWRSVDETVADWLTSRFSVDIIVASDVSYDSTLIPYLAKTLRLLITQSNDKIAFVVHCVRNADTLAIFKAELTSGGLFLSESTISLTDSDGFFLPQLPNSGDVVLLTITADQSRLAKFPNVTTTLPLPLSN